MATLEDTLREVLYELSVLIEEKIDIEAVMVEIEVFCPEDKIGVLSLLLDHLQKAREKAAVKLKEELEKRDG